MHVDTRVKAEVDKVKNAELLCTVENQWYPVSEFAFRKARPSQGHAEAYHNMCKTCLKRATALRKAKSDKKLATVQQIREALRTSGVPLIVSATLKQAGHKQRESVPLTDVELALLRERRTRREKEAKTPDLCYLVGIKGDDRYVKIGHSHDPAARLADYQAGNPRELVLLATLPGGEQKERELHRKFIHYHTEECVGEWFRKAPEIMNHFASGRVKA